MADHGFFIYKGQHKTLRFTATDAVTGDPLDLTDAEIKLVIRRRVGGEKLLEKDSDAGPTVAKVLTPVTGGQGEFYFVPADTFPPDPAEPVEAACYSYDAFAYDVGTGDKRAILIPPASFDIRDTVTEEDDWTP